MFSSEKIFLKDVYLQSLNAVRPSVLFEKHLHSSGNTLYFQNTPLPVFPPGRILLAGSGKASVQMAKALLPRLPVTPERTLLVSPRPDAAEGLQVFPGEHPLPGKKSLNAGKAMTELLRDTAPGDTVFYMLSGGSSSLLEYPLEGISMEDIRNAGAAFLERGMSIHEINALRSRLSRVKGGRLAELCRANTHVFVLSDVMGNALSVIGSGPFYPPPAGSFDPDLLIETYRLGECLPEHILGKLRENAPPAAGIPATHHLLGTNTDLLGTAAGLLEKAGMRVICFPDSLYGEAREAGEMIAQMILQYRGERPACILFGGETTVTLSGKSGKGGRSQETALSALRELGGREDYALLCAGSDGIDGNSDAAGALVDHRTRAKAKDSGLSLTAFLRRHDSGTFHERCESQIRTGYTGTNVNDIAMALIR
ncbi:MAG: DUF4147 domain-containing protein [Candidatus Marinimicrobia bacterium]|nr:DUF4147 domain-containing protein [Candidatus Neomarinimicrobiota bacterium]